MALDSSSLRTTLAYLKLELEEAENELEHAADTQKKSVQDHIIFLEREIRRTEEALDRMASDK